MYVYYVYYLHIICLHHSILPSELLGDCFIFFALVFHADVFVPKYV